MEKLSQSLQALSAKVAKLEDSATATFEADRAKLEQRRREIDASFSADRDEFESAVRDAAAAGRSWWNETTAALGRPVRELRARHDERQAEHEIHHAMRVADAAQEDAAVAIEFATYWLNVAEYAVIDATLARLAADDLAMAAGNQPVQVSGGVS